MLFAVGFLTGLLAGMIVLLFFWKAKNSDRSRKTEYWEMIGRLVAELAHEIKNPLSTVKVNLKLTAEDITPNPDLPDEQQVARCLRKIGIIQKETDRLEQILESFLKFADKHQYNFQRKEINELVSDVTDFFAPQCHANSVKMRVSLHDTPVYCMIDSDMLKQVLLNMFINAVQAMPGEGELMIRTFPRKDLAVIQIFDTGKGIEPADAEKIFDPFFSQRTGGSGLGLATAKRIVEAHKGNVSVSSEPGKGSLFTIEIPLEKK